MDAEHYSSPDGEIPSGLNFDSRIPEFKFALREDLQDKLEFLPTKTESKATGWDVRCAEIGDIRLAPFQVAKIDLGFRAFCPSGWWFELRPRSSAFTKKRLHALYGVIDEGYENTLIFACQFLPPPEFKGSIVIKHGDRIGQIIPVRRQEMKVTAVSNEEFERLCVERGGVRGTGGFGSSGDK